MFWKNEFALNDVAPFEIFAALSRTPNSAKIQSQDSRYGNNPTREGGNSHELDCIVVVVARNGKGYIREMEGNRYFSGKSYLKK